ncbi:hypothetical protein CCY99_00455 [Helicobacter sp. 16-1353]|uniref:hypothetical protein n=1 Tax=Helicobacter sp. 16-1353 TaxID=2004996 RepID=UPI000DCD05CC|nr:hypothetical protein [Helicobacter sp. 16-1353]RAX55203.1 hypothetical protein CCY99_00455 [Helicobacter sp. 16-1353]
MINISKIKNFVFLLIALMCIADLAFARDNYYRLDDYDSSYDKLEDSPLPPSKDKELHPSSIYKQERPPRVEKTPDYSRIEIQNSTQTSNRLENRRISSKKGYLLLGINGGLDLYAYDAKRQLSLEFMGKIGYLHYLNLNAFRFYFQVGGRFPLNNNNPNALALNFNTDFLLNLKVFHFYIGGGYGGEYYFSQKYFSHGFNVNLGISKSLGNHFIEFGLVIPFYTMYIDNVILKNNIIFVLGYNYKI